MTMHKRYCAFLLGGVSHRALAVAAYPMTVNAALRDLAIQTYQATAITWLKQ